MLRRLIIAAALALVALMIVIPFAVRRMVTRPLEGVLSVTEEISRGDLTKEIDHPSEDEIGSLVKAINAMKDGLRMLIEKVKDSLLIVTTFTSRVTGSARDLTEGAEGQEGSSVGVSESVREINNLVNEVAHSIIGHSKEAINAILTATMKLRESLNASILCTGRRIGKGLRCCGR